MVLTMVLAVSPWGMILHPSIVVFEVFICRQKLFGKPHKIAGGLL
jgi:hypothetical protein